MLTQGCQVLVTEKCQLCFKKEKILDLTKQPCNPVLTGPKKTSTIHDLCLSLCIVVTADAYLLAIELNRTFIFFIAFIMYL